MGAVFFKILLARPATPFLSFRRSRCLSGRVRTIGQRMPLVGLALRRGDMEDRRHRGGGAKTHFLTFVLRGPSVDGRGTQNNDGFLEGRALRNSQGPENVNGFLHRYRVPNVDAHATPTYQSK